MKTYWLIEKDTADNETSKLMKQDGEKIGDHWDKGADPSLFKQEDGDNRSLYTPILPEDVKKMSPSNVCVCSLTSE